MGPHPQHADAAGAKLELAEVFAHHGAAYQATHHLVPVQHRAIAAIQACRTERLGGHLERCDACGRLRYHYHSCRNRHCPKCQTLAKERWLAARRAELFAQILEHAVAVGVGHADPETIDRINILEATRRAMREAIDKLPFPPELVLTDAVKLAALPCPQKNLIQGDRRSASIAAASIVAKVTRDRLMAEYDQQFPEYGFARHKGYSTPTHRAALAKHGPCQLHRRTFHGVWQQGELFGS